MIRKAYEHKGTSLVEIYQNCNIFNDGVFSDYTEKDVKDDNTIVLEDGKPLIFGKERDKGIILDGVTPKVVELNDGYSVSDLLVHHEKEESPVMSHILANIEFYGGPVPVGIFRSIDKPRYEEMLIDQMNDTIEKNGKGDIQDLLNSGHTWNVN